MIKVEFCGISEVLREVYFYRHPSQSTTRIVTQKSETLTYSIYEPPAITRKISNFVNVIHGV